MIGTAWRSWKNAKSVAALSVLALAVGIGSTTAIFTVISSVMLRPLPYAHSDRMVTLFSATTTDPKHFGSNSVPDLLEYKSKLRGLEIFGWFRMASFNLTSPGAPQHMDGVFLTPELARGTGIAAALGQWFTDETGAVISDALWRRLGSDAGILGKAIVLSGAHYTITGVMPAEFRLPIAGPYGEVRSDVWLYLDPAGRGATSGEAAYFAYGRLRPGVTRAQTEQEVKTVAAEIARRDPANHPNYTARLDELQELLTRDVRPALLLLFGAAGLLLLITCANVAGLLLVRSVARARETAVRLALGAGTGQIARQYFQEGLAVSLAGAVLGIGLSVALVRIIVSMAASNIPRADEVALDARALVFAVIAAIIASALSSLAPLWQAMRTQANEVLSDGVRTSAGVRTRRLSRWLVVGEVALAAALLAVGLALLDRLASLRQTSPGFDPDHLLTFSISIPDSTLKNDGRRSAEEMGLNRALGAIPGVTAVGSVNQLPLAGCCFSTRVYPEGGSPSIDSTIQTSFLSVSPGYFRTMRIPLRSGRQLDYQDLPKDILLVNVNYAAARYFWPERGDAVGAYGHFLSPTGSRFQVVGVVGDVRNNGFKNPAVPEVYLLDTVTAFNPWNFVVRSPRATESLLADVRRAVASVDAQAPIHDVATMNEIADKSLQIERASSFMMGFFALAALLMATLGVYGVVSYSVRQRTVEMGIRMALGARQSDIVTLILGSGARMAALGCIAGGVLTMFIEPYVARWFELDGLRTLPLVVGLAFVGLIAIAASFFPAWRAGLLAPASAIRK
jgi:predicted permease